MKSATEVSTARRPACSLQVSMYCWAPAATNLADLPALPAGQEGQRYRKGQCSGSHMASTTRHIPKQWTTRRIGMMLGRRPRQPARTCTEHQPLLVTAGTSHGFVFYYTWLVLWASKKLKFHIGAEAWEMSIIGHWSKNKAGGWKSRPGHPFLSKYHIPFSKYGLVLGEVSSLVASLSHRGRRRFLLGHT